MNLLYPKFSLKLFFPMFCLACAGALVAGTYGIVHDQITYTISPEYFTNAKFLQFHYANFGFPSRVFVAEIGFLATWWVGFAAGWFLARIAVPIWPLKTAVLHVSQGFAIMIAATFLAGCIGAILGLRHSPDYSEWSGTLDFYSITDASAFVTVAYIHNAGYLGGLVGLVGAILFLVYSKSRLHPPDNQNLDICHSEVYKLFLWKTGNMLVGILQGQPKGDAEGFAVCPSGDWDFRERSSNCENTLTNHNNL